MIKSALTIISLIIIHSTLLGALPASKKNIRKAKRIHDKVLTIDSHNDTPLRMVRPDFDWGERHDAKSSRSKVDLVRMEEGGLDGAFFAIFV